MGAQQSKDELVYQQVTIGNVHAIRSLRRDGAGLEWRDKEGRTPLILACTRVELLDVAECLIELGADIKAYRPGSHGGTPLHHAAKRGLHTTVRLLLLRGANAMVRNDDGQTPLDMARAKGYFSVVRVIEGHICLFCDWVRELSGPGILETLAPQWVSKKVWVVIIPVESSYPTNPRKFELAIYPGLQVALPRTVIPLWKMEIEEPKFNQPDPMLIIFDKRSRARFKFLSANEGDKEQVRRLYEACRGISQPLSPLATAATSSAENLDIALAINASIQSAPDGLPTLPNTHQSIEAINANGWGEQTGNPSYNGWGFNSMQSSNPDGHPSSKTTGDRPPSTSENNRSDLTYVHCKPASEAGPSTVLAPTCQSHQPGEPSVEMAPSMGSVTPSAPPLPDDGLLHYPAVDSSRIDLDLPSVNDSSHERPTKGGDDGSSACVICWDAPIEGACIPCGHLAGCMVCLNEIKAKNWGCPVCRAKIDQAIRVYTV